VVCAVDCRANFRAKSRYIQYALRNIHGLFQAKMAQKAHGYCDKYHFNLGESMFSHVMLGSNDIERSKRFYDAVLGVLGAGEPFRNVAKTGHVRLFYRHEGATFCVSEPINDQEATRANGGTIGFKCSSPEQVRQFHDVAVAHGGTSIEEPPGLREGPAGALHRPKPSA
jgi:catechol 2,3-dioxygenase-like lactoylglutathione lyase family enzyme